MPTRFTRWWASIRPEGREEQRPDPFPEGRRGVALWGVYAFLIGLLLVMVLVSHRYEESEVVQRFAPNVATETLGIIVTLVVVHRLLERQERARRLRAAVGAVRKTGVALSSLVEIWARLVKGALDPRSTEYPRTVHELFAPYYTEELSCLDPAARLGTAPGEPSWLADAVQRLAEVQQSLREVILTYGGTLESDYLEALDELTDDPFVALVARLGAGEHPGPEEWRLRLNQSRGHQEAHFVRLLYAVRLHNRLAQETARFRSRHLAPRAQSLTLQLGADRDLAIRTELPSGWWSAPPSVGGLRAERQREAPRSRFGG